MPRSLVDTLEDPGLQMLATSTKGSVPRSPAGEPRRLFPLFDVAACLRPRDILEIRNLALRRQDHLRKVGVVGKADVLRRYLVLRCPRKVCSNGPDGVEAR